MQRAALAPMTGTFTVPRAVSWVDAGVVDAGLDEVGHGGGGRAELEELAAFAGPANSGKNPASMREQPYSLGLNRNILVRPMSYDIGFKIKDGREDMVRYDLERAHLHPSHLQVGVGTDTTSNKITHKDITTECAIYHTYRVGLIHWHVSKTLAELDKYVDHDKALNPDGPQRGTLGQPMQGPLGPQRIAAFEAAGAAEKARTKPGK
jgi:hypothetical protein